MHGRQSSNLLFSFFPFFKIKIGPYGVHVLTSYQQANNVIDQSKCMRYILGAVTGSTFIVVKLPFYHGKLHFVSVTDISRGKFIVLNIHGYVKKITRSAYDSERGIKL